ncbi:restriction endonuclease subunit S [Nitrobacter sp. TKz-YC01]|uniref:restriction endonuclease subunit S n=1 Tax=Nitrobacter sp. TKz-YC01 TaxID=3398703 RepID=UPI003A102A6D
MKLVLCRQFRNRPLATDRLKRNLGLELSRKSSACLHTGSSFSSGDPPYAPVSETGTTSILRPEAKKLLPRFFYFSVRSPSFAAQIRSLTSGSAQPQLPIRDMRKLRLPLPPFEEQARIVEIIGSLDDKIELNRRMNETLEAMAQAIFRDWFVDFGPTRRKIDGATDPVEIMGGLVADPERARELAALFPARIGDDGLPEGWSETPIGELAEIVGGSTPSTKSEEYWNDGHHIWATPKDLSKLDGLFLFDTERRITDAGLAKIGSGLSPAGTVLLSSRAPIGYLAVADAPTAVNQGFIAIRPSSRLPTAMSLL